MNALLTIFTPTYNRAYCLKNLYESLKCQTNREFVWLIVDDGSTDETKELVTNFILENQIKIIYKYKQNGGKHTALMRGIELTNSELFVCVDSDDTLTKDAVEIILDRYAKTSDENLLGYYYRRITKDKKNIASAYPYGMDRVGITDLYNKYGFSGDTMIVLKTKLIEGYKFPVFEGERFVTERVLYNQLNHIAPMLLCEEGIYVSEYLEDGYTVNASRLTMNNPYGFAVDCLSEAYYVNRFFYQLKKYAQYLAAVSYFELDKGKLAEYNKTKGLVKLFAIVFCPHYKRRFKMLDEKLRV